jgi:hypothetical protein
MEKPTRGATGEGLKQFSDNEPLSYATFALRATGGGDFASQSNSECLLKPVLPYPPAIRKIYDRGELDRSPEGGKPRLPPECISSCLTMQSSEPPSESFIWSTRGALDANIITKKEKLSDPIVFIGYSYGRTMGSLYTLVPQVLMSFQSLTVLPA